MAAVWYATLEEVKAALDSKETARNNAQLARLIDASTDSIERDQLRRRFYPEVDTRKFDWPTHVDPADESRALYLGVDEMVAVDEVTVDGVTVDPSHITELADGGLSIIGLEFDSTVGLITGSGRRAVEPTGAFGAWDRALPAGTLAAAVADDTVATITVSDSSATGTGQLLKVGDERMIVDRKSMIDSGQNLGANLDRKANVEVVPVSSGAAFTEGEVVLIDAEKMRIVEIAGNNLIVDRAWDGSTLAEHTTGAAVFAPRVLTVRRGVLGTTAAQHDSGVAVTRHVFPGLVNQLCIAETLTAVMQENAGYGRSIGSGEAERDDLGAGLPDLRERVWQAYGRKI